MPNPDVAAGASRVDRQVSHPHSAPSSWALGQSGQDAAEQTPTDSGRSTIDRHVGARSSDLHVEEPVQLTPEERAAVTARAFKGLVRAVAAQGAMACLAAVIAWAVAGPAAGLSALAGAGMYLIPNALFAFRLMLGLAGGRSASPVTFLLGEIVKLSVTVVLLWLLSRYAQEWLVWPAVLWGLVLTLKGYFLLLMFRKF
ncbi:MAG: ATP synthase subunit I [Alcaligenaceae bacterium]|nr:MAG: ATP synthase subunit I [Alcaligenaceae bacterium]